MMAVILCIEADEAEVSTQMELIADFGSDIIV